MRCRKALVSLLLVMLFSVPAAAQAYSAETGSGPAAARGEYRQTGAVNLNLTLVGNLYQNSNFTASLPNNATIISASVDLEGNPVMGSTQAITADFASDPGSMYVAYAGTYTKNTPGNAKPSTFQGNQLTGYELGRIQYSDNGYSTMWGYGWNNEYAYHRFSFRVPLDVVSKVSAQYEGFSGYSYSGTVGTVAAYVWNNRTQNWDMIGSGSDMPKSTLSNIFTGGDYIWAQGNNRFVDVLAMCQQGTNYYGSIYTNINSDYVKIYVEGNVLTYPKNPRLYVGNSFNPAWSLQEDRFSYLVSIGEAAFMNQIQDQTRRSTSQNADVRFNFKSDVIGRIRVSNLSISYTAPPWCTGIQPQIMEEDTPNARLINLNDYFTDDIDKGRLKFEIIEEENAKWLDADISADGTWMGFKMPTKNWHGTLSFKVRAIDSDSLTRDSNRFTVTVVGVNDAPVVGAIGRQVAMEDTPYTFTVRVKDVDAELDPGETVVFSDNSSLFEVDQTTGKIAFTPRQEQVGTYMIGIIATDLEGATDQENFTLEIQDSEDPPLLDLIPDQTAMQDVLFTYTVAAADPDLPYGDALSFTDDSPLFVTESSTGLISFTPAVKDIGSYMITMTVNDARGGTDSKQFTLNVVNPLGTFNRPPAIEPFKNQTAQEGTLFELVAKGSDPDLDLGDSLSFQDNCPIFDISSGNGRISFKPTARDAGVYKVKITVKDREGQTASAEFTLTVLKTNHAPQISEMLPRDGTKILAGRQFRLSGQASDADGDKLNYTWKDGDVVLGYGPNITASFPDEGTYIITLVVSDGNLEKANETTIEIVSKTGGGGSSSTPGFGAVLAAAAAAVAALGIARRRKRRARGSPGLSGQTAVPSGDR